jgi:hypothetical protein
MAGRGLLLLSCVLYSAGGVYVTLSRAVTSASDVPKNSMTSSSVPVPAMNFICCEEGERRESVPTLAMIVSFCTALLPSGSVNVMGGNTKAEPSTENDGVVLESMTTVGGSLTATTIMS